MGSRHATPKLATEDEGEGVASAALDEEPHALINRTAASNAPRTVPI